MPRRLTFRAALVSRNPHVAGRFPLLTPLCVRGIVELAEGVGYPPENGSSPERGWYAVSKVVKNHVWKFPSSALLVLTEDS